MAGRRYGSRWPVVWTMLAWCVAGVAGGETGTTATRGASRTWLLMQQEVATEAVEGHEARFRAALERIQSSQPIELFLLRDDGYVTLLATAHVEDGLGASALDPLPRALGLESRVEDEATAPPPRLLHELPAFAYRPSDARTETPTFFRYAFFRVPVAEMTAFEALLARRRSLFQQRGVSLAYDVLASTPDGTSRLYALATGAASRDTLDRRLQVADKKLGRPGWRLERALARTGAPAGALEGTMVLTWAATSVEARFATRGLPPGGWVPTTVPLEPLPSAEPPPLVAVAEPLPPPPTPPPRVAEVPAPVAPPSAPDPRPTAADPETVARKAVLDTVEAWRRAWSGQRIDDYLGHYSRSFQPAKDESRSVWEARRRERLARPRFIDIEVSAVEVGLLDARRAWVEFEQRYRADHYRDRVHKRLELVAEDGGWRIRRELVLDWTVPATSGQP